MRVWRKTVAVSVVVSLGIVGTMNQWWLDSVPGETIPGETIPGVSQSVAATAATMAKPGIALPTVTTEAASMLTSTETFRKMRTDLATAQEKAASLTSYVATLDMQEEVNGRLRPMNRIHVKVRQQPFSVYMRWTDNEQEVLFVEGQNDDRLLVKPAKGLAALKRLWRIDPESRMAKQGCRYPVTDTGIQKLIDRVQEFYAAREDWASVADFSTADAVVSDTEVTAYTIRFRDQDASPEYGASQLCFEPSTGLLISVQNFGWSENDDDHPLVEHYVYGDIRQDPPLQDTDFDEQNEEYSFVVK